ncbi:alpha/beta hydrolase [Pengzhenrongella frigida]|uniref:Alpha/beta hydrolase n=1 Tax=Pengzhenrongella frigida TaxID=1259133 RepID=A0A4Q5N4E4_9MICO|nr:alpha/beta hydrolase [Cellulomonas sp. HLT2-17]RYV51547.1 alpha/beta hydrolase [Cellulomonas sp. HLT2-17]
MTDRWQQDILGPDFQALTLDLGTDDEGPVVATLVRFRPPTAEPLRSARAVLYVHGWSDYFFQTELAAYWHAQGAAFYAVDLRKFGRSLRPHQTPGYVDTLTDYDDDLAAALAEIRGELGPLVRVILMGHSTGGLVSALWLQRNPGEVGSLVLNSPWLELQGSAVLRNISTPAITQLARFQPKTPMPNIDAGFYARTIDATDGGEWVYNTAWRPTPSFPVRAGWLRAIIAGHAEVARGLSIDVPILTLASARSLISPRWSEGMRAADIVIDVDVIVRRAVQLGRTVTVIRIEGGLHDLVLSPLPVRQRCYAEITRWTVAYGWG